MSEGQQELWEDYRALADKYSLMPGYEFGYLLIQFSVKMLMDTAPRHRIALETIKVATEEGIKWHVEERLKRGEQK
jgi:hypothetical protein